MRLGPSTLYLTLGSILVTLAIAVPIALHASLRGATSLNRPFTLLAYMVSALPVFWFGYIVVYLVSHNFGMFPLVSAAAGKAAERLALCPACPSSCSASATARSPRSFATCAKS